MDEQALLLAIINDPDDDLPRLAYADWCDENGQPERAEFIRGQIRLTGLATDDPERGHLERREQELLQARREEWLASLPDFADWEFCRGFVERATLPRPADLERLVACPAVFGLAPIRGLVLGRLYTEGTPAEHIVDLPVNDLMRALAAFPPLRRVRSLQIRWMADWASGLRHLVDSLNLSGLERLDLDPYLVGSIGMQAAQALAEAQGLTGLSALLLWGADLGEEGVRAIVESSRLSGLRELGVSGSNMAGGPGPGTHSANIGPGGVRALASSPGAARLRRLDICCNELDDGAVDALVASPHLDGLEELIVAEDHLTEAMVRRLRGRFGGRVRFPYNPPWEAE